MKPAAALALSFMIAGCTMVGMPAPPPPQPTPAEPPAPVHPPGRDSERLPVPAAVVPPPTDALPVGVAAGPSRRFPEIRGLWVVRTTLTDPQRVRTMVDDAANAGFNTLLVQVRGRGDAYYDSRWEPRAEALARAPAFDPLALVVSEAHARGMAVHAWVNTHLVWGAGAPPSSPDHIVNGSPQWLAVPRALGRDLWETEPSDPRFLAALRRYASARATTVEGLFTSPSDPEVQERVYRVAVDLAERYEIDGIHLDYVRFPGEDFDYSRGALERFRSWVGPRIAPSRREELDSAYLRDPYAFVEGLPGPWGEFRRLAITQLVERVYDGVKARRAGLVVSAAVFANAEDAYASRFQDWRSWLADGILDVAVPMAYTPLSESFRNRVREAATSAGGRDRFWAGIGVYLDTVDGTLSKIDLARVEGAGGVVLFSYDWAKNEAPRTGEVSFLQSVGRARFGG